MTESFWSHKRSLSRACHLSSSHIKAFVLHFLITCGIISPVSAECGTVFVCWLIVSHSLFQQHVLPQRNKACLRWLCCCVWELLFVTQTQTSSSVLTWPYTQALYNLTFYAWSQSWLRKSVLAAITDCWVLLSVPLKVIFFTALCSWSIMHLGFGSESGWCDFYKRATEHDPGVCSSSVILCSDRSCTCAAQTRTEVWCWIHVLVMLKPHRGFQTWGLTLNSRDLN